jgi:triosephosphate isomerase
MRIPLIAGNWKLNMTEAQAIVLSRKIMWQASKVKNVEVLICPPYTALSQLHKLLISTSIKLGAQNMYWQTSGAYTGEISPVMLAEFCQYVILGHSERRAYFSESDEEINRKVAAAINYQLIPILCVGEKLEEKDAGKAEEVIYRQVIEGLKDVGVFDGDQLVVAYEPVWAIGTGRFATDDGANKIVSSTIRPALVRLFGKEVAQQVRVLYGGSVTPENAARFLHQPEIDGALVGGASLKPESFVGIVEAAG